MKKTLLFTCFLAICLPVAVFSQTLDPVVMPPQPKPAPPVSAAKFVGTWNTSITYTDGDQNYQDIYQIDLFEDSTCVVTVRTQENGKELHQDADGSWSYNDIFFRLDCFFSNPVIKWLPSLKWRAYYELDANNRRLVLRMVTNIPQENGQTTGPFGMGMAVARQMVDAMNETA
jgi:hypothetical protein